MRRARATMARFAPRRRATCTAHVLSHVERPSVVSGRHTSPILEPAEHDLDAIAPFVASLVVFHGRLALLSAGDAGAYPFVFQRVSEPVGVIAPVPEQPFHVWQATQQSPCADTRSSSARVPGPGASMLAGSRCVRELLPCPASKVFCRRDRGLKSGTAHPSPDSSSRLATKPVVCRSGRPSKTLMVRQAWIAASLYACWRPRRPEGAASHCIEGSNQTVSDPRCLSA